MLVIIVQNHSGIGFYKDNTNRWASLGYESMEAYYEYMEGIYAADGIITYGIIEEDDLPSMPEGALPSDLYWDGEELVYGNTDLIAMLFRKRDDLLESSLDSLTLNHRVYSTLSSEGHNLMALDNYAEQMASYRASLIESDDEINRSPRTFVFPVEPDINNYDLSDYKSNKVIELKESFDKTLADGLISEALGSVHKYDGEVHNIEWIYGCILLTETEDENEEAQTPYITCDDMLGNENSKIQRMHAGSQCRALLSDGMTAIQSMKDKLAGLETDVDNAADEAAVDAVVWI